MGAGPAQDLSSSLHKPSPNHHPPLSPRESSNIARQAQGGCGGHPDCPLEHTQTPRGSPPHFTPPPVQGQKQLWPCCTQGDKRAKTVVCVFICRDPAMMAEPWPSPLLAGRPQDRSGLCPHDHRKPAIEAKASSVLAQVMAAAAAHGSRPVSWGPAWDVPLPLWAVYCPGSRRAHSHPCPHPLPHDLRACPSHHVPTGPGPTFFRLPLRVPMKTTECWR